MSKILIAGSLADDHLMTFDGEFKNFLIPNDFKNFSVSFQTKTEELYFGGCAGNIAYTSALLGDIPYVVSIAGS
ncbi:MAG: carbohydrate kinase family protein, partial [Candidatus Gracilibacteria bacterium]